MKIFKILAAAAVLLNTLPLVADARLSTPSQHHAQARSAVAQCTNFNLGLYGICLPEGRDGGKAQRRHARYLDNMKRRQPAK